MAPRDPCRPAAKHIQDEAALRAVLDYHVRGGPCPVDALTAKGFPAKVVVAKLHKLERRGWLSFAPGPFPPAVLCITSAGLSFLEADGRLL